VSWNGKRPPGASSVLQRSQEAEAEKTGAMTAPSRTTKTDEVWRGRQERSLLSFLAHLDFTRLMRGGGGLHCDALQWIEVKVIH